MFTFLMFVLWVVSLVMMIVSFHWGWLVAFIFTLIYLFVRFGAGGSGGGSVDFDFGGSFD